MCIRDSKITELLSKILNDDVDINNKINVNFENENISKYIDCGNMNDEIYVDYINRIFGARLSVIINFEINKSGENFIVTNKDIKYKFMSKETGTRWIFKTNKYNIFNILCFINNSHIARIRFLKWFVFCIFRRLIR